MFGFGKPAEGIQAHPKGTFRITEYGDGTRMVHEYDCCRVPGEDYYTWDWHHGISFREPGAAEQYVKDQKARRVKVSSRIIPA